MSIKVHMWKSLLILEWRDRYEKSIVCQTDLQLDMVSKAAPNDAEKQLRSGTPQFNISTI
jgi:hypothetical protein